MNQIFAFLLLIQLFYDSFQKRNNVLLHIELKAQQFRQWQISIFFKLHKTLFEKLDFLLFILDKILLLLQKITTFDNLAWKSFCIYERLIFAKNSIFIFKLFWFGFVEDLRGGILMEKVFFKKRMNSDVIKVDSLFGVRIEDFFEKILDFGSAIFGDFFPGLLDGSLVAEIGGKFNEFFAFLFGFWGTVKFEGKLHIEHEVE